MKNAQLAQLVEHRPYKAEVVRSSRTLSTKIDKMLLALLGTQDLVDLWWNSRNKAFMGKRPIDVEEKLVYEYVIGFLAR